MNSRHTQTLTDKGQIENNKMKMLLLFSVGGFG